VKIDDIKIKLKDIQITPFNEDKLEDKNDIMYLYYTLEFTSKKETITFDAYDFPVIQHLSGMVEEVEKSKAWKYGKGEYFTAIYESPFGMEHHLRLNKFILSEDKIWYNLHIYNSFGKSVLLEYLSKEELDGIVVYVEKKIQKAIDEY